MRLCFPVLTVSERFFFYLLEGDHNSFRPVPGISRVSVPQRHRTQETGVPLLSRFVVRRIDVPRE